MTTSMLKGYRAIVAELAELEKKRISGNEEYCGNKDFYDALEEKERAKKEEIEEFVAKIPDGETRLIFCYRYIFGRRRPSWQSIAFKVGKTDESYPRRKHERYMTFCKSLDNAQKETISPI